MAGVKKHGRWEGKEGVERYSNVHIYVKALSHLTASQLEEGESLLEKWGRRPETARQ